MFIAGAEKMLDDGQIATTFIAASGGMPVLQSGARNDQSPTPWMCFHTTNMVRHYGQLGKAPLDSGAGG